MAQKQTSYLWLAARARNALRRRALVSIASGTVFVLALVGLVLIPHEATRVARSLAASVQQRPDTTEIWNRVLQSSQAMHAADSTLTVARRANVVAAPPVAPPQPLDTLSPELKAVRDTLTRQLASLERDMARAAESPLPPAFKALGESPALAGEARVRVWLDSLDQVDKLRAPFGALGAGDPIYVALTARVNELGRSIRDAASDRRSELRARIAPLQVQSVTRQVAATEPRVQVDTMRFVLARARAESDYATAARSLDSMRVVSARITNAEERARNLANVGAPPIAMLGAALVIALAAGFALALAGEVRYPRVAHVREGEAVSGARVLAVIEPSMVVERARRQADADAPPLVDIISQSYRTLYLHLAATGASVPIVTVTGDIPAVVATIATNLAAVAAYEARSALLVDADPATSAVASVLRIESDPGLNGVLQGRAALTEVIVATTIGRDRPLDVLPSGHGRMGSVTRDSAASVREALSRMERRYDFIVIAAPTSYAQLATDTIIPVPDTIVCARVGATRLSDLRSAVKSLRGIGRVVHGIVLWDDETPRT